MKPKLKLGLIASIPLALFLSGGMWLGRSLGLTGWGFYLFWLGFGALGAMIGGAIFWFMGRLTSEREGPARPPLEEDLLARIADIRKRLDAAQRPGLKRLPTVVVVGPAQGGKSSAVLGSESAAEQLTGDRFGGGQLPPTKSLNAWYSDGTAFLEVGEGLREDPSLWAQFLQKVQPKRLLRAIFLGRAQAHRAVVVCFPCQELRQRGGLESVQGWGRSLRTSLLEMTRKLGAPVPVYVLFTKADEIPSFSEYSTHLRDGGASQVLGTTLPLPGSLDVSSFADRQGRILKSAFDELFRSLALKRIKVLDPDLATKDSAKAYEFPREFQKLSANATQFLLELCKPSQLQVSPFLRGFYFVGRREETVEAGAPPPREEVSDVVPVAGATQVFDPGRMAAPVAAQASPAPSGPSRGHRWLFLPRVFRDVILQDKIAVGLMGRGRRVNLGRRVLLGAFIAVVLLLFTPLLIGSFNYNRGLQQRAEAVLGGVGDLATEVGMDTGERLRRLDALRDLADTLADHRARRSLSRLTRWFGLFSGSRLQPRVLGEYSLLFRSLLLEPSLQVVEEELRSAAGDTELTTDYDVTYRRLRAYLMSTTNPERGEVDFLSEVLTDHWPSARNEEDRELVLRQFDFFGRRLLQSDAFALPLSNARVVEAARDFLTERGGPEPFYQSLVNKASRLHEDARFDDRVFRSSTVAIRMLEAVPGAFSPQGWDYVKAQLSDPDSLPQAEEWVLGPVPILDRNQLAADIDSLYSDDYRTRWERLLTRASVAGFRNASDASEKLGELSGEYSQLVQLVQAVYERAGVLPPGDFSRFQALEAFFLVDSIGEVQGLSDLALAYLEGLRSVETAMGELAEARGPERIAVAQDIVSREVFPDAQRAAEDLKRDVRASFESRALAAHVSRILDEPIDQARYIALGAEPAELNARGAEFCREYNRVVGLSFPFDPRESAEPSMEELGEAFKPQESLVWNLLFELEPYVELRGSRYYARAGASVTINPDFLNFLGNARRFSEAVFSEETGNPEVRFRLRPDLDESSGGVTSVTVDINGRLETCLPTSCRTSDEFTWDGGTASQLGLSALVQGENVPIAGAFRGAWSAFRFFSGTTGWRGPEEDEHTVRWRIGPSEGEVAVTVVGRVSSAFNPAVLAGLRCVPTVVARR